MRINRTKTAVVALATAGLLALGSVAYAGDDNEVNMGGTASNTNNQNTATAGGETQEANGGTGGAATGGANQNGCNTNNTTTNNTTTTQPDNGDPDDGAYKGGYTLVNVGDVNVDPTICPVVPVLSPSRGGDAKGGSADGGSIENNASNEQNASVDSGNGHDDDKHKKYKKSHKKKCKKSYKKKCKNKKYYYRYY